jgi:outer membrane protein assembly factor BamB
VPRRVRQIVFFAAVVIAIEAAPTAAQVRDRTVNLPPAEVEELDATSAAHLEHARRFLAAEQWSEAVEAIRRVPEEGADRLIRVDLNLPVAGFGRYVPVGEYCQWRLAQLADEAPQALNHYRRLVDPLAERWLREGEQNNDEALLQRVVNQAFASRYGDEALLKLGDLALARGEPAAARAVWQRLGPAFTVSRAASSVLQTPSGSPLWMALRKFDFASRNEELRGLLSASGPVLPGVYPDSDIDPAAVQARLVLASLIENSRARTAIELATLRAVFPLAEGTLAGVHGRYVDRLQALMEDSTSWSALRQSPDWPTFGGNSTRGRTAPREIDPAGRPLWTYPLPPLAAEGESFGRGGLRPADHAHSLLGYHPVVIGQTVLFKVDDAGGNSHVVALDLRTGRRLWQADHGREVSAAAVDTNATPVRHTGALSHTLSVAGTKLFARAGSAGAAPRIRRLEASPAGEQGVLLGLDITSQGQALMGFPIHPISDEWTFEGTPLSDGNAVYVAMRRADGGRSQLHVAAFELQSTASQSSDKSGLSDRLTGRLKWRTRVCSSATFSGGEVDQRSHLLVTLDSGRIYLNTSAGAVAALSATDGQLLWVLKYPRAATGTGAFDRAAQHWFRDLTPCLAANDLLIVAPADSGQIFAAHAASGQLAWALPPGVAADAVHLLGVQNDVLLASGNALYWIDAWTGQLLAQFPRGQPGGLAQAVPAPRGFGRGVLTGNHVWWPTRDSIFVFAAEPMTTDFGRQPRLVREIQLAPLGLTGGNLVLASGVLLIAGADRLVALGE